LDSSDDRAIQLQGRFVVVYDYYARHVTSVPRFRLTGDYRRANILPGSGKVAVNPTWMALARLLVPRG
jgi:hypothetical protein